MWHKVPKMNILGTFFLIQLFAAVFYSAAYADNAAARVIQLAQTKNITEMRAWKKLLHIEPNIIGIKSTQISDNKFYLSNSTDYKKYSELEATLVAFTESAEKYARQIAHPLKKNLSTKMLDHSEHPICRFPARLMFLKSELYKAKEYWESLPKLNCVFQDVYLEAIAPSSISFVFSSYYSDSPGSAFGHTFFRINRTSKQSNLKQELLDYGVGYAANVTVSNAALYSLLGLTGGFKGSWTNLPYYYKVREYNHFEARDLWSYDLNLTPEEVKMLALHLWEVGPHFYTYYFFTQNCAFHMLTLLEAAAPRLHLIEHVPFYYVIPSDSMKALFYEKDLVKNISFRPSLRNVFLERINRLDNATFLKFEKYAQTEGFSDSIKFASEQDRALFLDAALDLHDLRYPSLSTESNPEKFKTKESLLQQRALVNFISPELDIRANINQQPEGSHGSSRIALAYETKPEIKSGNFEYRFALHDLQDPQFGLPQNSQLEFFNLKFKILPGELRLQEANIFNVLNLNPINFFEKKASWGVELGVQNKENYCDFNDKTCFLSGALFKYGAASNLFSEKLTLWGLGTLNLRYGATLLDSKYYVAPGFEIGLIHRFSESNSFLMRFSREYPIGHNNRPDYDQNYEAEYRHSFYKDINFGLRIKNDYYGVLAYYYF